MPVIVVEFRTLTDVSAVPPNVTVAPVWNPVPVIVTLVPPSDGPLAGEAEAGAGGAT